MKILKPIQHFINLLYPNLCETCNASLVSGENLVCTTCRADLPFTFSWQKTDNEIEQVFWGRTPIEHAAAYFYFARGSKYRILLHKLKYQGRSDIGIALGNWFGSELSKSDFFNNIDFIVPVPLHPKKQQKRGYNQSEMICRGMSQSMNIPLDSKTLVRAEATSTQTKKNRLERWQNVSEVFTIAQSSNFDNKHILLVDDVLTTGATLEACCKTLLENTNCKISIATIAFAH